MWFQSILNVIGMDDMVLQRLDGGWSGLAI